MAQVIKTRENNMFVYTFNGEVVRKSNKEFKFACIARYRECKRVLPAYWGKEKVASLGNNADSTLKSNQLRYRELCDMYIVEIQ